MHARSSGGGSREPRRPARRSNAVKRIGATSALSAERVQATSVTVSVREVHRDLLDLSRRVRETIKNPSSAGLEKVHGILRQSLEEMERVADQAESRPRPFTTGETRLYFPSGASSLRDVSDEEMQAADARWQTAVERGRSYREDVASALGPLLTPADVARRLGVTTVTVNNWRRQNRLVAVQLDSHRYLYPEWQFTSSPTADRGVLRNLHDILVILDRQPWEKAWFFASPLPALGGRTPLEALKHGTPADLRLVREAAETRGELGA